MRLKGYAVMSATGVAASCFRLNASVANGSEDGSMKIKAALILSVAVNIALGVAIVLRHAPDRGAASESSAPATAVASAVVPANTLAAHNSTPAPAGSNGAASIRITSKTGTNQPPIWTYVESDDYHAYIANLRQLGCPEETIRDIILTDLLKQYSTKVRELRNNENQPFWKAKLSSYDMDAVERRKMLRELTEERSQMYAELVGGNLESDLNRLMGADGSPAPQYKFLAADRQQEMAKLMNGYNDRLQQMHEASRGFPDSQTREAMQALVRERDAAMESFLTPDEKRQRDLRYSETAVSLINGPLTGVDVSQSEYERIYDLAAKMQSDRQTAWSNAYAQAKAGGTRPAQPDFTASWDAYNAEVKSVLGDERYREFERSRDNDYRNILRFTQTFDLPQATAAQIYETRAAAQQQVRALFNQPSVDRNVAMQQVRQIEQQTEATLRQTLGDRNYATFAQAVGVGNLYHGAVNLNR